MSSVMIDGPSNSPSQELITEPVTPTPMVTSAHSPSPTILVMFDIDGTLVHSQELDDVCYKETARQFLGDVAINTNWQGYRHVTNSGITTDLYWEHLGCAPTQEQLHQFEIAFAQQIAQYLLKKPQACGAIAGAAEFLQSLQQCDDIALAIATGGWRQCAETKLRHGQIPFEGIPFASATDAIERVKIMELACDRAQAHYKTAKFSQRIYIGDGLWDVAASAELGYRFIGIATGKKAKQLSEAGATEIYPDFNAMDVGMIAATTA